MWKAVLSEKANIVNLARLNIFTNLNKVPIFFMETGMWSTGRMKPEWVLPAAHARMHFCSAPSKQERPTWAENPSAIHLNIWWWDDCQDLCWSLCQLHQKGNGINTLGKLISSFFIIFHYFSHTQAPWPPPTDTHPCLYLSL